MRTRPDFSVRPLCQEYDTALLDLDGVVYTGARAIDHAVDSLAAARGSGMRLAYVTNNASRTPQAVAEHLTELGIPAHTSDVITSAQAVARLVAASVEPGARVLVVGGQGLVEALTERGLRPVRSADDGPQAVVQGYAPHVGWADLAEAAFAINRGVPWFASNADLTIPTARGTAPGNGALIEAVRIATGSRPQIAGKPLPPMHRETVLRTGAKRPLVVGDRLDTDIEGAHVGEVDSLLVFTGVTTAVELLGAPVEHRPTYLAADLRGLLVAQPEVVAEGGGFRCGGWLASVREGVLGLDGKGDRFDGLRALCAAAWTWTSEGADATGDARSGPASLDLGKSLAELEL